jgi:hypothetical protein
MHGNMGWWDSTYLLKIIAEPFLQKVCIFIKKLEKKSVKGRHRIAPALQCSKHLLDCTVPNLDHWERTLVLTPIV